MGKKSKSEQPETKPKNRGRKVNVRKLGKQLASMEKRVLKTTERTEKKVAKIQAKSAKIVERLEAKIEKIKDKLSDAE